MDEAGQATPAPQRAGDRLRVAREALGLPIGEIAQRTRVPQRHLEAIEAGDYSALPSHTYATGFAKAYARAIGVDEVSIGRDVRDEIDRIGHRTPEYQPYEASDPARLPSRGLSVVAFGIAVALVVLVGLWYTTDLFRGVGGIGGATTAAVPPTLSAPVVAPGATPAAAPVPVAPADGAVVLAAGATDVWLRVYDGANKTLYIGTLTPGERFAVPADADRPMINVGRPDQLVVTLNGSPVAPLGDGRRAIRDVPVDGRSIAARAAASPVAAPGASPSATSSPAPSPAPAPAPAAAATPRAASTPTA